MQPDISSSGPRRPLKTRSARWAIGLAAWLARRRVSPNTISLASVLFATIAGLAFLVSAGRPAGERSLLLVVAAVAIQLRLLCNLLDGMVAVEGGLRTPAGEVFNDLPDRIADPLILVSAGYAIALSFGPTLGWAAGLMALMTAYVRLLGGSLGLPQDFRGPMAKPHRMAILTAASLAEAVAYPLFGMRDAILLAALAIIAIGSAVTVARRTSGIVHQLESRNG